MVVEVFASRSGPPSLRIDGRAYHSPFDPAREAERFLDASLESANLSVVVLLGEGLGFLSQALRRRLPGVRIISLQYSTEVSQASAGDAAQPDTWHPSSGCTAEEFLRSRIGELDVEGLRVLEWPPAAGIFPEQSRRVQESLQQCLRELNGTLVTTMAAGKLWVRNCIANFLRLDVTLHGAPCEAERAVVIAAPGPSLEAAAPVLREFRSLFDLWALPSSALFLRSEGLQPDLLVMTDPGYYAINHLRFTGLTCPVAMPLSAARGLWALPAFPYLLSEPGVVEEALFRATRLRVPQVAPHGTVSATAMDLALSATRGPVIFAGLDLCARDIAQHARPNAFEQLLLNESGRLAPFYSASYHRSAQQDSVPLPGGGGVRVPRSLRIYGGWFAGVATAGRVYRLFPSAVALPGMTSLDSAGLRALLQSLPASAPGNRLEKSADFPSREERRAIVQRLRDGWVKDISAGLVTTRTGDGLRAFADNPSLFQLSYVLEAQLLLEAKRKARLGDTAGARETAVRLLEQCKLFLETITTKALNAG